MGAHTGIDVDVNFLQQILLYNKSKYLLWDGYRRDGTKKQKWVEGAVDLELHSKGIKKQGGLVSTKETTIIPCIVADWKANHSTTRPWKAHSPGPHR